MHADNMEMCAIGLKFNTEWWCHLVAYRKILCLKYKYKGTSTNAS